MRLAYLVTAYPEVSHTFIRREILELERRGHSVLRLSIRTPSTLLVDPLDLTEQSRTTYLLAHPLRVAAATLRALLRSPLSFARALAQAFRMARKSDRGLLRHVAYLAEASLTLGLLRDAEREHLHVHFGTNSAAVGLLTHVLGGPPWSFTAHGPDEFDAPIGLSLKDKIMDAERAIAISSFGAAQLRRWAPPECWSRIAVVRCTFGTEFDKPLEPIPPNSRTLVSVGRLSAQKGHLLLVEAFAVALRSVEDAELVFAGDGELRAAVEQRASRLGVAEHVRITGWLTGEQVHEHLRASRALVMPSFAEGLPVAIIEAFAVGRPVVATYVGGVPELVETGRSGWLVPAGSVDELAAALCDVLSKPISALETMGATGALRARLQHHTSREVDALLRLWETAPRSDT